MANAPSRMRRSSKAKDATALTPSAPQSTPDVSTPDVPRDDAAIRALGLRMDRIAQGIAETCDKHKEVLATLTAYSAAGETMDAGALHTMGTLREVFTDAVMLTWPIVDSGLRHTVYVDGKAIERNNPNPAKYKRGAERVIRGKRQWYMADVDFYKYVLSCMAHGKKLDTEIQHLQDAAKEVIPDSVPAEIRKLSAADRTTRYETLRKRRTRHLRVLKDGVELFQRIHAISNMTRTNKDGAMVPAVVLSFAEPDGEYQEAKIKLQDANTGEVESFYASELLAYRPEKLAPGKGSLSEFRGTKQTAAARDTETETQRYTDVADFFSALRTIYDTLDESDKGKAFCKKLSGYLSKVHEIPERQEDLLLWGQTMDRMQEEFSEYAVGYRNLLANKVAQSMALLKANPDLAKTGTND